jgi:cell division protein FtsI (penicillin-binding protein 3)
MTTRSTRSQRRRTVVALGVVLAILGGFIVRLVDIQVVSAGEHIEDSLATAFGSSRPLYGTRGAIVDETGMTLAGSILLYDAQLDPSHVGGITREKSNGTTEKVSWPDLAAEIGEITGQTGEEVQKIVEDARAVDPDSQYAKLKRGLSTEQYRELAALGIPFLYFDPHPSRMYPDGAVAGNLVGYMGIDGEPLGGLEQSQNDCLSADDGRVVYEKGKDGVVIPGTEVATPAVDGGTLQLTINRDLQWYLQQLIAEETQNQVAKSGAIFVVEVATGKVRAAADYPTVDPNDVDASDPKDHGSRIFTDPFEPGSTFKPLTAATVIDAGGQTPLSTVFAAGDEKFPNGAKVSDSFDHPTHEYTLTGVLIDSSNAGISKFAERVSAQTRYDYLTRFGIGTGSSIPFEGQANGWLSPPDQWDNQTFYNTSFGQGVSTTIPELAGAYLTIANDGVKLPLSIVESCTQPDGEMATPELPEPTRVLQESTAISVQQMMENVALQSTLASQIEIPGYRIADKTGTGEIAENGTYKRGVYFTTMIGFAPADDPQYLVVVTLNEPTKVKSSAANASAFQKAMTQVLKTYRVMPATSAPTVLPKFAE